jgi:hypothetical protein
MRQNIVLPTSWIAYSALTYGASVYLKATQYGWLLIYIFYIVKQ